jgi:hypothetical protein
MNYFWLTTLIVSATLLSLAEEENLTKHFYRLLK